MKKFIVSLALTSALLFGGMVATAQDLSTNTPDAATLEPTITPTPVIVEEPPPNPISDDEPAELPVTTPETLLGQLFSLLKDGTYIAWAAAGVVVIVGLLKIIASVLGVTVTGNAAIVLTLIIQVLVWLGYAIANYLNQGEAFKTGYLVVVDIARSLLPLAGAIFTGHLLYQQAAKRNVPIMGYYPKPKAQTTTSAS